MTFREQLKELRACSESLKWVGNKTIEEAWETCKNSNWMIWVLSQTDLDLTDPICDMVKEVLDLLPENSQLACILAVIEDKKLDNQDVALYSASYVASYAAYVAAYATDSYAAVAAVAAVYNNERQNQCDILRKYFTIDQVKTAFNKLVA